MAPLTFRARLLAILGLFTVIPAIVLTFAWGGTMTRILPMMSGKAAWDTVASSGAQVLATARRAALTPAESAQIAVHERALLNAATRSRQFELLTERAPSALVLSSLVLVALLAFLATRVAGHLTRQLTRPLHEVVSWTGRIVRGEPLPDVEARGAPEFAVLRTRMREMSVELAAGRRAAIEAERLAAMRETARQVAHELKNPLTPIRFAVARLRRRVPDELADAVAVLDAESARLDEMARSFAQFGRLPEGPVTDVDVQELVDEVVRATVPNTISTVVEVAPQLVVRGRGPALSRALANVLLNAVEACGGPGGTIRVDARHETAAKGSMVSISVTDSGPGVAPDALDAIWQPYVTTKAGGTGLGLAIVRQTMEAHGGTARAESGAPQGLRVVLSIPVDTPPPGAAA